MEKTNQNEYLLERACLLKEIDDITSSYLKEKKSNLKEKIDELQRKLIQIDEEN